MRDRRTGPPRTASPVDRPLLERMCAALEHRGPDSRGIHPLAGAGLGIQRLRVIDLETGDQPIYNEDRDGRGRPQRGDLQLPRSCARRLERVRHTLRDPGRHRGDRPPLRGGGRRTAFASLHGMFGVRDLGRAPPAAAPRPRPRRQEAPLLRRARRRAVASRRSSARCSRTRRFQRDLDHAGARLATSPTCYVPAPLSAFSGVRKLPPATTLVCTRRPDRDCAATGGSTTRASTTSATSPSSTRRSGTRSGAQCERRMVADVPLGAFLSGGIDSSAVVAAMAQRRQPGRSRPSRSASSTRASTSCPFARRVAEQFGTEHHELIVRPDAVEILPTHRASLRRAVRRLVGDPELLPRGGDARST